MPKLTIALSKGRILAPTLDLLARAGYQTEFMKKSNDRKLVFKDKEADIHYIMAKPPDIPTYVEYGVADLGVVGKDVLLEQTGVFYELLDLKLGFCRMVLARHQDHLDRPIHFVASKYPRITEKYFQEQGKQVEVIKLHGSVELAPLLNLAEAVVDLVSTGKTLRENKLVEVEEITSITSRLVANQSSYQMKSERVQEFVAALGKVVNGADA